MGRKYKMVGRRGKLAYRRRTSSQYAKLKESYVMPIVAGNINYFQDALANLNFDRAQAVAQAYQQYRISYIKLTIQPNYDTFVNGGAPGSPATIPQMYFMVDKTRSIPNGAGFNTLLDLGCKPVRMDERNISRAWKPSVLQVAGDGPATAAAVGYKLSPWLTTNANAGNPGAWLPDETLHHGAVFGIEKSFPADAQQYDMNVEIGFEFRKPNWKSQSSPSEPQTLLNAGVITTTQPQA